MGQIINKDENIISLLYKKTSDVSKHSNSLPEVKLKFLRYLSVSMVLGIISFYFLILYLEN